MAHFWTIVVGQKLNTQAVGIDSWVHSALKSIVIKENRTHAHRMLMLHLTTKPAVLMSYLDILLQYCCGKIFKTDKNKNFPQK